METILISQEQIKSLITVKEIVDSVEKTFRGLGDGTVLNPTKLSLDLGESGGPLPFEGYMNAMPAYVGWADAAGIKWAGGFLGERKKKGLPYITSMILMLNPHLGNFTSVMDGAYITNMRTGAQTAIAMQYILPEGKKSVRLGLFGAGMQGSTQIMSIAQRFDIEEVVVYDIDPECAKTYASRVEGYVKGKITVVNRPEDAAVGDAIISVTHSLKPFIKNEWVQPGTAVFPMGSYQECESDFILNTDKIIVDHVGQALHRGALAEVNHQGKILEEHVFSTIGELVAGKKSARIKANERYICVPIGTGCMDIGVASIVEKRAREQGIGESFSFV